MLSTRTWKWAFWGLACALFCALPARADLFVVAGGKNYKNTVVVAQSGSPYTSVQAALDSIGDAATDNRYLVFVAPGTYTGRFTMKHWVDIAGSGPNVTILQAPGGATFSSAGATCTAADNATLSDLTVKNTGVATLGMGVYGSGVSPTLSRVRVEATGASNTNYGIYFSGGIPNIKDSTVIVSGANASVNYAAMNGNSHATYQNCDLGAYNGAQTYALFCSGGEVNLQNCRLLAEGATSYNYGMKNQGLGADVVAHHTQITANSTGAFSFQYGIFNTNGVRVELFGCEVEARNGSASYGVVNQHVDTDLQIEAFYANRCSIRAKDASANNIAVYSNGESNDPRVKVYLNQCDIEGATSSVANGAFVDTYIGASWLSGGATDAGTDFATMKCAGCYDTNYNFNAGTCP